MQRIHLAYDSLPEGERRVADLALESPGELAMWSAGELAARAGVSAATVSRFVRRLGYAGYEAARRDARAMREGGSPLFRAEPAAGASPPQGAVARHLAAETAAIERTLSQLDPVALDEIAASLAEAPRVRVLGWRNSHFAAEYLRSALAVCRPGVQMIGWGGQTAAESLGEIRPGDMAVAFGLRRRPRGFAAQIEALAAAGADVALISDPTLRGTAVAAARWRLACAVETPQAFDTLAGAMALARLLMTTTMARLGPEGRRQLERVERLHETLDDLE
ncbi:MAG: MurR/RpiR family transcriptional regulator [Pseudomonadota bacterium]|nr:MurR/RpiR family transcriptional regulator [Pseudomonadota bacterium]